MKQLIAILFTVIYFIFIAPLSWSNENGQMIELSALTEMSPAAAGHEGADPADFSTPALSLQAVHHHIAPGKSIKAPRVSCLAAAFHKYLSHAPVVQNTYRPYTGKLPLSPTVSVEVLRI